MLYVSSLFSINHCTWQILKNVGVSWKLVGETGEWQKPLQEMAAKGFFSKPCIFCFLNTGLVLMCCPLLENPNKMPCDMHGVC